MQRNIEFSEGEYYHVYNRGVEKREIFLDDRDRRRFMRLLFVANGTKPFKFREIQDKSYSTIDRGDALTAIGAYCLMPNHFHILAKETSEGGISKFMEKLGTGYSMYFNKKNARTGFLFQGNFKAEHVDSDEYLKYLYAYIHLNPVKLIDSNWKIDGIRDRARAERYLSRYDYSSYIDYVSTSVREEKGILAPEEFPGYFERAADFSFFIKEWLEYSRDDLDTPSVSSTPRFKD